MNTNKSFSFIASSVSLLSNSPTLCAIFQCNFLFHTLPFSFAMLDQFNPFASHSFHALSNFRLNYSAVCFVTKEKSLWLGWTLTFANQTNEKNTKQKFTLHSNQFILWFTWQLRMQNGIERRKSRPAATWRVENEAKLVFKCDDPFFPVNAITSGVQGLLIWFVDAWCNKLCIRLHACMFVACFHHIKCKKECARRSINCSFCERKTQFIACTFFFDWWNVKWKRTCSMNMNERRWLKNIRVPGTWPKKKERSASTLFCH